VSIYIASTIILLRPRLILIRSTSLIVTIRRILPLTLSIFKLYIRLVALLSLYRRLVSLAFSTRRSRYILIFKTILKNRIRFIKSIRFLFNSLIRFIVSRASRRVKCLSSYYYYYYYYYYYIILVLRFTPLGLATYYVRQGAYTGPPPLLTSIRVTCPLLLNYCPL